ncbi:hypothetical protein Bpfe_024611, partial [Biomphalaria pfeifferi]
FTVSRFPVLNLLALQCNGSHLPSDVRSVQHISLERHSLTNERPPYIIASLSSVDGVRLENSVSNINVYVSGKFDMDNIHATSLTVLLADVSVDPDNTYKCTISYVKRGGSLGLSERLLNVSLTDLQKYKVQTTAPKQEHHLQKFSQSTLNEIKEGWGTSMYLLLTMAILLFALLIICILLIVDRYRDNCNNKKRKKATANEIEPRPLPTPPLWTYPDGNRSQLPRSPYNSLKFEGVKRIAKDDTGYDSDGDMNYCMPMDDIASHSKNVPFKTFGKHSPIYASTPTILT